MTLSEQERMVFDYISGSLAPPAEQDFYIQLALDAELQQTLKAMQIVERAIHKDRKSTTVAHTQSREHVLGLLGISHAPTPGTGVAAASSVKWGFAAFTASSFKWTLAAVAASSLAIGTYILAPILQRSNAPAVEVIPVSQSHASETYQQLPSSPDVPGSTTQKVSPITKTTAPVNKRIVADTSTQTLTPVLSTSPLRVRISEKDTIKLRVKIEPGSK